MQSKNTFIMGINLLVGLSVQMLERVRSVSAITDSQTRQVL